VPARRESRVALRPLGPDDQDEFIAGMRASRRLHGRWLSPPTTPEEFGEWLRRTREDSLVSILPRRREDGAIVGYFNISQIIRGHLQSAFLGYGAVAAHAERGYMTEGLELVLEHAFTDLSLHRLEANIQPGNDASIALARRCGFVKEGFSERYLKINGRWRDHERWAIRSEQWRAHRRR
jgi:ribosomal-protein-alanine N-acetyltransferase